MSGYVEWLAGRDQDAALVIRTDYDNEQAWAAVKAELLRPWGDGDYEPYVHLVDNPTCGGFTPAQILSAASTDEELSVVYLADRDSMRDGPSTLLAVAMLTREECESDEEFEAEGGMFRSVPAGVHEMHANLMIANMSFGEFKEAAKALRVSSEGPRQRSLSAADDCVEPAHKGKGREAAHQLTSRPFHDSPQPRLGPVIVSPMTNPLAGPSGTTASVPYGTRCSSS
ncbi:DUF6924 domain-containing protein [Streptomyces sp. B21-083]|uniref:DUF6924 domain-containing protein n=1 Tax=Streptomyces sp. B21-083 TaxID=3039410 RepID=UPI002FF338CF